MPDEARHPNGSNALVRLPAEGDGGLFSQSWFAICLSGDVSSGQVCGFDFLGGRIVVMRGENGVAQALSAYCPHLGADLSVGDVIGNEIRCAFHHLHFDCTGSCVRTGSGDPVPRAALFRFPTMEKHGVIYAFNGEKALYDLPDFPVPADELLVHTEKVEGSFPVDPWVICANTPDIQHIRVVHGVTFDNNDPGEAARWTEHSMVYDFSGLHVDQQPIEFEVGIYGTSFYYQAGTYMNRWFGFIAPISMPRPGESEVFLSIAVRKDEPDAEAYLESIVEMEKRVVAEDADILNTIRFKPTALTASDRTLVRFFRYLKRYPRAHPSVDFIT